MRGQGFEDAIFVIGEKGLIAVKEQDPDATTAPLKKGNGGYVTNMTPATTG